MKLIGIKKHNLTADGVVLLPAILERHIRVQSGRKGTYAQGDTDGHVLTPILAWKPDPPSRHLRFEVDTLETLPKAAALQIEAVLRAGVPRPTAAEQIVVNGSGAGPARKARRQSS